MTQNNTITKSWLLGIKERALLLPLLLLLFFGHTAIFAQTTTYKPTSSNLITNGTFDKDPNNSTTVTGWTSNPAGTVDGWRQDNSGIYGSTLFINRDSGTYTASSNGMTLCSNTAKQVKFSFTSSDTGAYTLRVKLGTQVIGTFTNSGGLAQSKWTPAAGVEGTVYYNYWPEHYVTDGLVNNNIWHKFNLYIPNYTGGNGSLSFEYVKTGAARLVYIDNVEVYEVIPTPVPTKTTDTVATCGGTYDLTKLNPAVAGYTYTWYADAGHNTPVANPKAVAPGTYYLFVTNGCQPGYSYASTAVTIKGAPGCCGSNLVTNGGFDTYTTSGTNIGNSNIKGTPKVTTITGWTYNPTLYAAVGVGNYPSGASGMLGMDATSGQDPTMAQTINGIATADTQSLSFQFALEQVMAIYQVRNVKIYLGSTFLFNLSVGKDGGGNVRVGVTGVNTAVVSNLKINGNAYTSPSVTPVDSGVGGAPFVSSVDSSPTPLYSSTIYSLSATLKGITSSTSNFTIVTNEGAVPFFDNVSISNNPPVAESPKDMNTATAGVIDGVAACPSNTFNLTTANPNTAGHNYVWYSDSVGATMIQDPTKVGPGTYYMKTVSSSGCEATPLTSFTVTSSCPTYSGKVFQDYNGSSVNGIAATATPATEVGTSGRGLYVAIVDAASKVINTTSVNSDGTFTLSGDGTAVKAILVYPQPAIGSTLTAAALQPNYVSTGEAINSTAPNGTPDGISPTWAAGTSTSNIYFGIQAKPVPGDASGTLCYPGANQPYTVPALYGVDDDPNFNSGVGQKVNFKSLTQTNGVLSYDGTPVTASTVIAAYDPAKLVFTPNDASQTAAASFSFTYTFTDIAGYESGAAGTINYTFTYPGAVTGAQTVCEGSPASTPITVSGYPSGAAIQWQRSLDNGATWLDFGGQTGQQLNWESFNDTKLIRAKISLNGCVMFTNNIKLTVALDNAPAPVLSSANLMVACGATTADASGITASNTPAGGMLAFFTSSTPSASTMVADATTLAAGTYYAAFYDSATGCYAKVSTPFTVYNELCVNTPAPLTVFTGNNVQRNLDGRINPTGGSGNYTYSIVSGCTPPAGAAGTINATINGSLVTYTAPATAGTYYYCVQICDTGNPQQCKTVTVTVNVTDQPVFACDNSVYLTKYNTDGTNEWTDIYQVIHNHDAVQVNKIGKSTNGVLLNDIAYNFNDQHLYGIGSHGRVKSVRSDAANAVIELYEFSVTDLPVAPSTDANNQYNYTSGGFFQSDISSPSTNNLYVMPKGPGNILYRIDIFDTSYNATLGRNNAGVAYPITLSKTIQVGDFTYVRNGINAFVGYDSVTKQIVKINPTTGEVVYVPVTKVDPATGNVVPATNTVTQLGGIYSGNLGNVYGKDSTTGTLYQLNMSNGRLYQVYQDDQFKVTADPYDYAFDATHCSSESVTFPTDIVVTKEAVAVDSNTPAGKYVPGQPIKYTIKVENQSSLYGVNGIKVTDIMPANLQNVTYYATVSDPNAETTVSTSSAAPSNGNINDVIYLPVGANITYTVTGTPATNASGVLQNTATVDVPGNFADINNTEHTSSAELTSTVCYKPAQLSGDAAQTTHGITALGRAGDASGWPRLRRGAWTVLEAKTKGFVVNRLTNQDVANIPAADLKEGMMVYNIDLDCLQINTDGTPTGWKCLKQQGCPDQ